MDLGKPEKRLHLRHMEQMIEVPLEETPLAGQGADVEQAADATEAADA